jgi:hypothetical protein
MIARVAAFHQLDTDKLDPAAVEQFRSIPKSTPGFVAGFHLRDPETGRAVSFTLFDSPEALKKVGDALAQRPDVDPVGVDPDEVDHYSEVIESWTG